MITNEVIVQVFRGGFTGADPAARHEKFARAVDRFTAAGIKVIAAHGNPRELAKSWPSVAQLGADAGVGLVAAWGLDGEHDTDGTPLTGKEKGECMAAVLRQRSCLAGLADAEGRWDDAERRRAGDVTDEDDALAMGEALRDPVAGAPGALVGDQCWFAIDSHGNLRKPTDPVLVADPQNVFAGFVVDEFARKVVNWFQFRQAYCNNFARTHGKSRYRYVFDWMERDWAKLRAAFTAAQLHYNPGVTIQAYGWDDIAADLTDCLLTYTGTLGQPLVAWWEPSTDPRVFLAAVRFVLFLQARGFVQRGRAAADTVRAYQTDYNRTAQVQIDTDGRGGYKTWASAGITP